MLNVDWTVWCDMPGCLAWLQCGSSACSRSEAWADAKSKYWTRVKVDGEMQYKCPSHNPAVREPQQ